MSKENLKTQNEPDISLESLSYREVYNPENPLPRLYLYDHTEISVIIEGKGVYLAFNQAIPCQAGDVFVTPSNMPHRYFLTDETETLIVRRLRFPIEKWFDGDIAAPGNPRYCYGIFNDDAATAYAMLNADMQERFNTLYNEIESELTERKAEWRDAIRGQLAQLLINIGRYINSSIKNSSPVSEKESSMVLAAIRAAKEQYGDPDFTLNAVAESFCVSKSHMSKTFKKLTGNLFSESLRNIRLEQACLLLKNSTMTVPNIVKACGLRDVPSFYKSFNHYQHMTPSEYRQSVTQPAPKEEENTAKRKGETTMGILNDISENLQRGKAKIVKELV